MKKVYEEPEIQIRNYKLPSKYTVVTLTSEPDLNDGDDVTYFGN